MTISLATRLLEFREFVCKAARQMSHTTMALKQRWNDRLPLLKALRDRRRALKWVQQGCPLPAPHLVKKTTVAHYARLFHCRLFVETGTYYGEMVGFVRDKFDRIYTIEIDATLHQQAVERFAANKHITPLLGDSAVVLPRILPELKSPCLFWLDGHSDGKVATRAEKNTPITEELASILASDLKDYVILIDDARLFGMLPDYPTLEAVEHQIKRGPKPLVMTVHNDIVRIHPPQQTNPIYQKA